jgi:FixJ family two-component response regulator
MSDAAPFVFVVDDDPSVRRAIKRLIESVGLQVELFGSTQEFLQVRRLDAPSCLVLDIRLRGKSGLDFQRELAEANIQIPIIFITAHGDIPMTVRAMKAGSRRVPDQTVPRSGSAGCSSARVGAGPCQAPAGGGHCRAARAP